MRHPSIALFFIASLHFSAIFAADSPPSKPADESAQLMVTAQANQIKGRYADAISLAEKALRLREQSLGPKHPVIASTLNRLAVFHVLNGEHKLAIALYNRALGINQRAFGLEHTVTADTLDGMGSAYLGLDDYKSAKHVIEKALAIREKVLGPRHFDTARSLHSLAVLYYVMGAYTKAEQPYLRAIEIANSNEGPDNRNTLVMLANLGLLYSEMGKLAEAEGVQTKVVASLERLLGSEHPDVGIALGNLATTYENTGAYEQAEATYLKALAIEEMGLGPQHPLTGTSINNLGNLYAKVGNFEKAEPLFRRSISIGEKSMGADTTIAALSLTNLAFLYATRGDYVSAEPLYRRAIAMQSKTLHPLHHQAALAIHGLATVFAITDRGSEAEGLFKRAIEINKHSLGPDHPETANTIRDLATLKWRQGNLDGSIELMRQAQTIQLRNSNMILLSGSESRKKSYQQSIAEDTYNFVSFAISQPTRASIDLSLTSVLNYKGRVLDSMSDGIARLRLNARSSDRALFDELADIASQRSTLSYQGPGDLAPRVYRERLDGFTKRQDLLEAELSKRVSTFHDRISTISVRAINNALPPDTILVEWFRYFSRSPNEHFYGPGMESNSARYAAYVIRRSFPPTLLDMGDAKSIETEVSELRAALSDPNSSNLQARTRALSNRIILPISAYIKNAKRLLVAPDGALNLIPLSALLNENDDLVGRSVEISYLTSGRDLLLNGPSRRMSTASAIVADPEFGIFASPPSQPIRASNFQAIRSEEIDRSGLLFKPLSGTAIEAKAIQEILNDESTTFLLGKDATESKIKNLRGPRILHIASHGFFLTDQTETRKTSRPATVPAIFQIENPMLRSGLALAGANSRQSGPNEDGILTALEVAQLDLDGTELVVLSACDSGVGDIQNGEGVYGLRRALVLAGAEAQVSSLWKVPDEATSLLMVAYYKRLLKGEGRSAALNQAQQELMLNVKFSHPYYWASFIHSGNWAPLSKAH